VCVVCIKRHRGKERKRERQRERNESEREAKIVSAYKDI